MSALQILEKQCKANIKRDFDVIKNLTAYKYIKKIKMVGYVSYLAIWFLVIYSLAHFSHL